MIEKYNMETFDKMVQKNPTDDDIFNYFVRLNKDYKKEKKAGLINDDVMIHLLEFWNTLRDVTDGALPDLLYEKWQGKRPTFIADIIEFAPRYNKIRCERFMTKLDPTETKETESLFNAIWEKNVRMEGSVSYYDWDEDEFFDSSIEVPRKDRDNYQYDFKRLCANVIYNRGNMLLKFYSRRGGFEIVGIHVGDGKGTWECLTKSEIQGEYTGNDGMPMIIEDNETVIFLERPEEETKDENVMCFHK